MTDADAMVRLLSDEMLLDMVLASAGELQRRKRRLEPEFMELAPAPLVNTVLVGGILAATDVRDCVLIGTKGHRSWLEEKDLMKTGD